MRGTAKFIAESISGSITPKIALIAFDAIFRRSTWPETGTIEPSPTHHDGPAATDDGAAGFGSNGQVRQLHPLFASGPAR